VLRLQADLSKVKQPLRISKSAGSGKALPFLVGGKRVQVKKSRRLPIIPM